ncbi:tetratricopeptide repeat protein [Aeromicrobium sp.]|uniref:tetratricopeptide repeat protein n=1 Tax=Aeromicrobium sp. TaxID=1871063 RepID=UPI003C385BAA
MTIHLTPNLTDQAIAEMEAFDAFRAGEDLLDSRFPRDAARVLRRVVDEEPAHSASWELLGRAHFAAAQLKPAEEAFRRLVELEPTSAWAQTALGLTLDRQSRHGEGAVHHRMAAAMGASARDATRVELIDRQTG